jgi:flagellar protein FlbD
MIWVTRLRGQTLIINADLIESVEHTPDTVVTMIDGRKYMVEETPDQIVTRVVEYRSAVLQGVATELPSRADAPPLLAQASIHLLDDKRRTD